MLLMSVSVPVKPKIPDEVEPKIPYKVEPKIVKVEPEHGKLDEELFSDT